MTPRRALRYAAQGARGFTVIELLIALAIVMSIAGVLAQVAEPARAAFDRVPAELDLQQRGRTAIDVIAQALRSSVSIVVATGASLTVMVPVVDGAQGILAVQQPGAGASLTLATAPCPNIKEVCGFSPGTTAMIVDTFGHHDVFNVASTAPGARSLSADRSLSRPYPIGAPVIEIDQYTFSLASQADGSLSLVRETAAGAIQPVVDFATSLSFTVTDRRVDVSVTMQAATDALRRVIADRVFRTSIRLRNGS